MSNQKLPFAGSLLAAAIALTGCGGSSGGSTPSGLANNDEGTAVISAKGGNGLLEGGGGGEVGISKSYGAGELKVALRGTPDADYELPGFTPSIGTNGLAVATDTVIYSIDFYDGEENVLTSGTPYFSGNMIYIYDGAVDSDEDLYLRKTSTQVTGIEIFAGATLTIASNNSSFDLFLTNDLINNGTFTTANLPAEEETSTRPNVEVYCNGFTGSGVVEMSGFSNDYPNGRDFRVYADYVAYSGTINANGLDTDDAGAEGSVPGGEGGYVQLNGDYFLENTGSINAEGGDSIDSYAGEGGDIYLYSDYLLANSGALSINGGTGVQAERYSASDVRLRAYHTLVNTGNISAAGSSAVESEGMPGSRGGNGGRVSLQLYLDGGEGASLAEDPKLINTGNLNSNGGAPAGSYAGGEGGNISIYVSESEYGAEGTAHPAMVAISGSLTADGYSSDAVEIGGEGGSIYIGQDSTVISEVDTQIVGYTEINTSGGSSGAEGGYAGGVDVSSYSNYEDDDALIYAPASPIVISDTAIIASGGSATYEETTADEFGIESGNGGYGGYVYLASDATVPALQAEIVDATVEYTGTISVDGGNASGFEAFDGSTGASGGTVSAYGTHGASLEGTLTANGGSASSTGRDEANEDGQTYFYGAEGGSLFVNAPSGDVDVDASVSLNAGNAANYAMNGGSIGLFASGSTRLEGSVSSTGGNADASLFGSVGGFGGQIYMLSISEDYRSTDDLTLTGGTGDSAGTSGGLAHGAECETGNCANQSISYYGMPR
ncbi:hypothetical protein [Thalassolituus sp. UBA3500]|uniref:hypothetical protein n=1 Tax=Thalassolituus sp. UBA3500 TaxID=1947664 RepID=UPI000C0DEB5C|nr:hypothetical protein [Thalassolituus sp. UBA3500]MBN58564.1 hypothetical protein [Oceanospirillaceae bacterium]|tara:strand:+ start:6326 stop:8656 length:2331 start_codon:yes stop_codon:yes gene_type:complete